MDKKVTTGKTILRIGCAVGGAVLFSAIGCPSVGAAVGGILPEMLGEIIDHFVENIADGKKTEKFLEKILENSFERLAELGVHFASGRIDSYYESYHEANEGVLNFDFPRAVVKVWEKALNNMLSTKRKISTLGLTHDYDREKLLVFWRKKLQNAQSDNELLKEFFGKEPDYFLEIKKSGKKGFIEALPDEKEVENIFWIQIEKSFTNWANNEEKFPKEWNKVINQDLINELKKKLFQNFGSALKKELKENERAWKSFEFASSLQVVSMLQTISSNIDQIKDDTSNIKKDLAELNTVLPLIMRDILNRFDALENTVKEFFTSNQNINELLIDFRKEVSEKLSEISKTITEIKENTERHYENLVTFQKWKEIKARNHLESEFDYVETAEIDRVIGLFTKDIFSTTKHFILKGDISTGKSTIINQIGKKLLELYPEIEIVILPLTPQFLLEEDWQRKEACSDFNDYLTKIAKSKDSKTVFIVEDAHEGEGNPGHQWTRKLNEDIDLSKIPIFISTRPNSFQNVRTKLNEDWKINPEVYETNPDETAKSIIANEPLFDEYEEKLQNSYLKCGKLLLIFNEIASGLRGALQNGEEPKPDYMEYAYEAIYEELERVSPNEDSTRLTLAIIWMAGGLEISLKSSFIDSSFHRSESSVWELLQKSNEIYLVNKRNYIMRRHPAWGLLAINAFDEYEGFSLVKTDIFNGFVRNLQVTLSGKKKRQLNDAKPSVLLMTALLDRKVITLETLGLYCIGRHIHNKFIQATGYYIDISLSKNEAYKETIEYSEALLLLAKSYRNSNNKGGKEYNPVEQYNPAEQRQEVIKEGHQYLLECEEQRKKIFEEKLDQDPKLGLLFYEKGYYEFLKGDFEKAAKDFQKSEEIDRNNPNRRHFAAMSAIVAARSFICNGKLEESKKILQDALDILNECEANKTTLSEFKCNAYGAYVELYLAERNEEKSLEFVDKCRAEGRKINLLVQNLLYIPRIYLLQKRFEEAEQFVKEAMKDEEFMKGAELKIAAHRILGDALLLQYKVDEAKAEYKNILPPDSDSNYLDFNMRIAKARMKKLDEEKSIEEVFQGEPI